MKLKRKDNKMNLLIHFMCIDMNIMVHLYQGRHGNLY